MKNAGMVDGIMENVVKIFLYQHGALPEKRLSMVSFPLVVQVKILPKDSVYFRGTLEFEN